MAGVPYSCGLVSNGLDVRSRIIRTALAFHYDWILVCMMQGVGIVPNADKYDAGPRNLSGILDLARRSRYTISVDREVCPSKTVFGQWIVLLALVAQ